MRQMWIAGARRRKGARRAAIFAASAAFHVGLFLIAFSRLAGDLVSAADAGGGPQGPVFAVSLVRLQTPVDSSQAEAASQAQPFLMELRKTAGSEGIPVPVDRRPSQFTALADRLAARTDTTASSAFRALAERVQPQGAHVRDDHLSDARSQKARTDTGADGDSSRSASTGMLWGAIEPCWRNMGFRGQVPVVVDVAIDGRGGLARPPTVVRSSSALLSEVRLKSEANALAALAACMPRGDVRVAGGKFRIEFPGTL